MVLPPLLSAVFRWITRINYEYSSLGDRVFFDPAAFPWTAQLAARTRDIQNELDVVMRRRDRLANYHDVLPEADLTGSAGWKVFFLIGNGRRMERNCALCPNTVEALKRVPDLVTAYFSFLQPGKVIKPHTGFFNSTLRCHLGLKVPVTDGRCAIQIEDQVRTWKEGDVLVFDETKLHQVWNRTDQWRVVLILDFKRPLPWRVRWINELLLFVMRHSAFTRKCVDNELQWEKEFYR